MDVEVRTKIDEMGPCWTKINHPDPRMPGYRIVGYRIPDIVCGGDFHKQMEVVRLNLDKIIY